MSEFALSLSLSLKLRKSMPIEAYTLTHTHTLSLIEHVCVSVREGPVQPASPLSLAVAA